MFTSLVFSMPPQPIMSLEVVCGQTDGWAIFSARIGAILLAQVEKHVGLFGINQTFVFVQFLRNGDYLTCEQYPNNPCLQRMLNRKTRITLEYETSTG